MSDFAKLIRFIIFALYKDTEVYNFWLGRLTWTLSSSLAMMLILRDDTIDTMTNMKAFWPSNSFFHSTPLIQTRGHIHLITYKTKNPMALKGFISGLVLFLDC